MPSDDNASEPESLPEEAMSSEIEGPTPTEIDDTARILAVLCHLSLVFGFPLWLLPLITRDNEFTLFHAKDAAVTWVLGLMIFSGGAVIWLMTCGLLPVFGLAVLMWLPMVMGLFSAANDQMEDIPIITALSNTLLGGIEVQ